MNCKKNNVILVFNNQMANASILSYVESLNQTSYDKLIIKLVNDFSDDFLNYKTTFSSDSLVKAQQLSVLINRDICFNFDIMDIEQSDVFRDQSFSVFLDLYIDNLKKLHDVEKNIQFKKRNKTWDTNCRIDLNLININDIVSEEIQGFFSNVDLYFNHDDMIKIKLNKQDDNDPDDVKKYINDFYCPTLIYVIKDTEITNNHIKLYLYGSERYFNTGIVLSVIDITKNDEQVKKLLLKKSLQKNCSDCNYKVDCIGKDFFISNFSKDHCKLKISSQEGDLDAN